MDVWTRCAKSAVTVAVALGFMSCWMPAARAQPSEAETPSYGRGYVPPSFAHPRIVVKMPESALSQPVRFDWREAGKVTSVKNQGSCGACYAFAALADFESKMLISGEGTFDFSENNVKECEWNHSRCGGGNYWRVANFLSTRGTVLESCDPYAPYEQYTCKESCPYMKTLLDWRVITFDEIPPAEVLKSYVQTYGPVYSLMDAGSDNAWETEFTQYDGSYTLYGPETGQVDHAVVIVGWDDTLSHAGGQGAWIVKNSWGTGWGGACGYGTERGYFTIAYGSASMGHSASFLYDWQDYDPDGDVLFHDEAGYKIGEGYPGSTTAWGLCKYVPARVGTAERVEFFSADAVTDVDVYVYDDFTGGNLSNLLTSELNTSFAHPGYHSIVLTSPAAIEAGDDIYVVAKITCASQEQPLPGDHMGNPVAKSSYKSPNGTTWSEVIGKDLGIRIRVGWDTEAPDTLSAFDAAGSDTTVTLTWVNPADADFSHTLIVYSESGYPTTPEEGNPVDNGFEGRFYSAPATSDTFMHAGLGNDVTYYYAAFAGDAAPNYSAPVHASATPEDSVPPAGVADFSATGSDRSVKLRWINPDDTDLVGVLIAYSTEGPLESPEGGYPVENGNDGVFEAAHTAPDSFTHVGLWNDTTYYYCITAFDEMLNHSASRCDSAVPQDIVPPDLSISVFQNPYITNHLDIYIVSSEAVIETSLVVSVGGEELEPDAVASERDVYRCDYDIYYSGNLDIEVCARDTNLNWGRSVRSFATAQVSAKSPAVLRSVDGRLEATVPAGAVSRDVYAVILEAEVAIEGLLCAYEVSPKSLSLDGTIALSITYASGMTQPEHLCIVRIEGGITHPVESYLDRGRSRVIASVDRFGTYGLYWGESISTHDYGGGELIFTQNRPNPFEARTTITYEVARPAYVEVDIIGVDGRLVTRLWEGGVGAGVQHAVWDGTDEKGRRVAGGVYLCRVRTDAGTVTRKMVILR